MRTLNSTLAILILAIILSSTAAVQTAQGFEVFPETQHKAALEIGDMHEARRLESIINSVTPEGLFVNELVPTPGMAELPESDWHGSDKVISANMQKPSIDSGKTVDIKYGEDGRIFAAVTQYQNSATFPNVLTLYKSTNSGASWQYIIGYQYMYAIGSLSLLVESKDNSKPDSTRLIVFYTYSSSSNHENATVNFLSARSNGTAVVSGLLATPPAGKKYSHVSAVSDGHFYAFSTYFGVVFTESSNAPGFTASTRTVYYRTINWGSSWTGAILTSGAADYFPSADLKRGSPDSVYIAVERRISASEVDICLLKTGFSPNSTFNAKTILNGISWSINAYRKPSLAIKKVSPGGAMAVSFTADGIPYYSRSEDGTNAWTVLYSSGYAKQGSVFTSMAASDLGNYAFEMIYMTPGGDTVSMVKIPEISVPVFTYKLNSFRASPRTPIVAALRPGDGKNLSNIAYAGTTPGLDSLPFLYSDYEGVKTFNLKLCLQGFYNSGTNRSNMRDTVRISLRTFYDSDIVVDSGTAVIDSVSHTAAFSFQHLPDGVYYFVVNHRNSLETWGSTWIKGHTALYDLTPAINTVFGNNLVQVDASPAVFAVYSGDVNKDRTIDVTDLLLIDNDVYAFQSGYRKADVNGDGFVDATDASITDNNAYNFVSAIIP